MNAEQEKEHLYETRKQPEVFSNATEAACGHAPKPPKILTTFQYRLRLFKD
jgi:hypothetical protein